MTMRRKAISVALSVLLVFAFYSTCYAYSPYQKIIPLNTFNEWDIVELIESDDQSVLLSMGIDEREAESIKNAYYDALYDRSCMTDEQLISLGYNYEQIKTLRDFSDEKSLTKDQIRSITATFSDYIAVSSNTTSRKAVFDYGWAWSQAPLVCLNDSAGAIWRGVDDDGHIIDMYCHSKSSAIVYYNGNTAITTITDSTFEDTGFDGENVQFQVRYSMGSNAYMYAKYGTITLDVRIPSSISVNYNYVRVLAKYAHTTFGIGYPSMSLGSGFSISFSIAGTVSTQGGRQAMIYDYNDWEYI